ncbi:MAG: hypothetical protein U0V48_14570 [Anaerolineales bacterium]
MKQRLVIFGTILSLILSACGGEPAAPTLSSADIGATAQSAAFTMIAQTQAAVPTDTPLPPTATFTSTPLPTDTATFTPTVDPAIPTATFTLAAQSSGPTADPCNKVLSEWKVPTMKIKINNETQPSGKLVLSLFVKTAQGECGFIPVTGGTISGPEGYYSAAAFVDGEKDFKVFGGFLLTGGSWTIIVRNETIIAKGGCYPNC